MQLAPSAGRAPTDGGCLCVSPATGAHHFPRGLLEDGGAAVGWSGAKRLAARSGRLLQRGHWPLCANYPRTGCRCAAVSESSWGKTSGGARMPCETTGSAADEVSQHAPSRYRRRCAVATSALLLLRVGTGSDVCSLRRRLRAKPTRRRAGQSIALIPCKRRACERPHGTRAGVAAPAPRAWDHGLQRSPGELQCQTSESCAMSTYSSPPVPPGRDAVVARAQGRGHRTR
jgi:hypothetical protein